jgi:shikimate dehydrogenase
MPPDPVLSLADLESWSRESPSLAVLGHPIGHSLSPRMHNAALTALARTEPRFADWKYFRFDVPPEHLPRALELLGSKGFLGVNLTVPHKIIAFDLVEGIDAAARPAGAVNTLLRTGGGWRGFNTDGYGLSAALREDLGRELAGAAVVLLGAGGAARAAAVECLARGCRELRIMNRTRENREALLEVLRPIAGPIPVSGDLPDREGFILINATSSGLRSGDAPPADLAVLPRPGCVFEMIYNPPRTPLLAQAEALGLPCANGLSMLVHQGARALEIWTGMPASKTAPDMRAAVAAPGGAAGRASGR